jgi:hypothetical protein
MVMPSINEVDITAFRTHPPRRPGIDAGHRFDRSKAFHKQAAAALDWNRGSVSRPYVAASCLMWFVPAPASIEHAEVNGANVTLFRTTANSVADAPKSSSEMQWR